MMSKDNVNIQTPRNLENDNYMVLYFNQDCEYAHGFAYFERYDIDFIIDRKNNINMVQKVHLM